MKNNPVPHEIQKLSEQIGSFIEYWGFKKIHGEIWTHIWLAKTPLDATILVKRLQVSKALISLAIKDLLSYDVIRIAGKGNRRKILLEANKDVRKVIESVLLKREVQMLSSVMFQFQKANSLSTKIKTDIDLDEEKLQALHAMISLAQISLTSLIDTHLRD